MIFRAILQRALARMEYSGSRCHCAYDAIIRDVEKGQRRRTNVWSYRSCEPLFMLDDQRFFPKDLFPVCCHVTLENSLLFCFVLLGMSRGAILRGSRTLRAKPASVT